MVEEVFGEGINKPFLSVLEKLDLGNKTILSLGCGSASLESVLEDKYGCKVTGLDFEDAAIRKAKERISKAQVLNLEEEKLKKIFSKESFDFILCADILEHLRNPDKVLKECKQLLNTDGKIIISMPNVANWSVRLNLLFGKFEYSNAGLLDTTHVHFYTLKTLKELIRRNEFAILSIDYSTSLINILYLKVKQSKNSYSALKQNIDGSKTNKYSIKKAFKYALEMIDKKITYLFPRLFAYQFIIVVKKKNLT